MNFNRFNKKLRNWKSHAGFAGIFVLCSGAALAALPDNPKDPELPPTSMGDIYEDSRSISLVRTVNLGPNCSSSSLGQLRLLDGTAANEGRLEICVDVPGDTLGPLWGTICDDYWTDDDAAVACRQLGYSREESPSDRFRRSFFGAGSLPIVLDDMRCDGDESSLLDCTVVGGNGGVPRDALAQDAIGVHNCRRNETVGVRCLTTSGNVTLRTLFIVDSNGSGVNIIPRPGPESAVGFNPSLLNYFTRSPVPAGISHVSLHAQRHDPLSTVEFFDDSNNLLGSGTSVRLPSIAMGWTRIEVRVTADDSSVQSYFLNIERR